MAKWVGRWPGRLGQLELTILSSVNFPIHAVLCLCGLFIIVIAIDKWSFFCVAGKI